MTTPHASSQKRTNVRIIFIMLTGWLVAGCATLAPRTARVAHCPPSRTLACEQFGAQHRCTCIDTARLGRELESFGVAGWAGFASR